MNFPKIIHQAGRYWFLILIVVLVIWGIIDEQNSKLPPPAPATEAPAAQASAILPPPVSLSTGTVIKRVPGYLHGEGELEIDNGTSDDAVAKLITTGTSGISVLTVYIKASSNYTIKNISDGTYRLAFAQGLDWDTATKSFTRNQSFSSFDESFDFQTSDTQYTTFTVTLNPVEGGTAQTSSVDGNQFNAY